MTMRRIFPFLFLLCFSCQKVVTLKLNNAPPQLIIEGNLTDGADPDTVKVLRSVNFYADNSFPTVSGAVVTISDNTGAKDNLTEVLPGNYITHTLRGVPGNTYTLSVTLNDTTYTASSTMPQPVPIDSVTFSNSSQINKSEIVPVVNFQDPPGIANYYRAEEHINGALYAKRYFVFSDRLSDGRYLRLDLTPDSTNMQSGDILRVDVYSVDQNDYNYFFELNKNASTGGFDTNTSPANPTTNLSNGAYGYFSAHTVLSKTVTVH
jgi:hypothetical protein